MSNHNFRELKVWEKSKNLVVKIFKVTQDFPNTEIYGLTQQIRRSAVSIPSNIAEGCGRNSVPQLKHFLQISQGSAFELETQLIISHDLNYLQVEEFKKLLEDIREIQNMIYGFQKSLN